MRRYLVVANQTLGGDALIQAVRERMLREPSEFWVLVPATKPAHFGQRFAGGHPMTMSGDPYDTGTVNSGYRDDAGESLAQQRLDTELQRLHEAGADADGEVGDPDPYKAVSARWRTGQFDEIIVSTLPHARSRWLRQDLPSKLKGSGSLSPTSWLDRRRGAGRSLRPAGASRAVSGDILHCRRGCTAHDRGPFGRT